MISTACLLRFPPANGMPSDDVIAALARHAWVWLFQWKEGVNAEGQYDISWTLEIADRVRAANPRVRIGLYATGLQLISSIDPHWQTTPDADLFADAAGQRLATGPLASEDGLALKAPNLLEVARYRLIDRWRQTARCYGLDGILFDRFSPEWYALKIRETDANGGAFGRASGIGPDGAWRMDDPGWCANALGLTADQLRWQLEADGVKTYVNGLYPYPYDPANPIHQWLGFGNASLVDHASGALVEHCVEAYTDPAICRDLLKTIKLATDKRRDVFLYALPWYLNNAAPPDLRRFMLAWYLLVQEPPYTSFGYSDVIPFCGWGGLNGSGGTPYVFWDNAWETDYGVPLESYQTATDANGGLLLAWRTYLRLDGANQRRMIAVVNPTSQPQPASFGGTWRVWDQDSGAIVSGPPITIPPKTGWVLWRQ
jgi:hypothetical protein